MLKYLTAALLLSTPVHALDVGDALGVYLDRQVMTWAQDPLLMSALEAQNIRHAGMEAAAYTELDQRWSAELGRTPAPLVDSVLQTPASDFLRARMEESKGLITEVFMMDVHGLNVASAGITSDIWQGDEAKFTETFAKGTGARHFSQIEFDDSRGVYQTQMSFTLSDPVTGAPIGAMTVGINAEMMQ
ncbi:hypothetical protein ACFSDD_11480 [Salipiger marinus]|uniref:hypothetical protein n=1 Tax=Salipiger marinus TaxID=555512 RepID=UPI001E5D413D|nr:hypothetical protein [Salipiger manganoxidans]MCD1616902.1 hypothetical protein [Salipiger manganoxidans]MEB3419991.1 hypothetical protein [Salipiger manganoxidans]